MLDNRNRAHGNVGQLGPAGEGGAGGELRLQSKMCASRVGRVELQAPAQEANVF